MSSSREMGRKHLLSRGENILRGVRRSGFWLRMCAVVLLLAGAGNCADLLQAVPARSRQLVLVTTSNWTTPEAQLRRFFRTSAAGPWRQEGAPMPAQIGANGLAWGRGLHRTPGVATRRKREGDRCAPAGVFRLTGAFGQLEEKDVGPLRIPYQQVCAGWEAVDDPASRFYNRIVNRTTVPQPDWRTSERLFTGAHYRLAIVVAHNTDAEPGAGSCIFLHEWLGRRRGTAGCTVLRGDDLRLLVRWLDAGAEPVLVQAPEAEIPAL